MEHPTSRIADSVFAELAEMRRAHVRRRSGAIPRRLIAGALVGLAASPAAAALREYRMQFQPSPSTGVAGYTLHVGTASRTYQAQFDLGLPPASGGTVNYALDLEDSVDLYVALRAYTATGLVSTYSSELRIASAPSGGTDGGTGGSDGGTGGTGGGTGGSDGGTGGTDGGSGGGTMNPPGTLHPDLFLGIGTNSTAMLSRFMPNGSAAALTMDSLAATGNVRPVACDLEGDGDRDLVIGFGQGSAGQVAILTLEDGAVIASTSIAAGPAAYRSESGRTLPSCGDVDGDGRAELVIGFTGSMRGAVQVFDDVATGFAPLATARSNAQGYMQIPVPSKFRGMIFPALGDIDGDGRAELVAGMSGLRSGLIAVLDDSRAGFALHPVNRTGRPWYPVEPSASTSMSGGMTVPALGDLDGDGRAELVVGFGSGSRGRLAVLEDAVVGWPTSVSGISILTTGRSTYQSRDGAARPALGDVDDDGVDELVVGFLRGGAHELQAFDDLANQLRPIGASGGFVTSSDTTLTLYPATAR